jgi:hypothetical protein
MVFLVHLHAHEKEIVRDDFEQVLFVLAEEHQPEDGLVDGEAEEAFAVGAASEPVKAGFARRWSQCDMSILKQDIQVKKSKTDERFVIHQSLSKQLFQQF